MSQKIRWLQARIDRLAFKRENTECALMYATKRFLPGESHQCFDAKSKFTECQGTLGGNRPTAHTLQVLGQQVFRPIDNSQVFRAAAFDCGLRQPAMSAHNEVQRLYDHAFATASGQLFPPPSGFFNARCVGYINRSVRLTVTSGSSSRSTKQGALERIKGGEMITDLLRRMNWCHEGQ